MIDAAAYTPETSPVVFWGMIVITLATVGVCLFREGNTWYLRWSSKRRADRYRNSPRVMRQQIKDLQSVVDQFTARDEAQHKKLTKQDRLIESLTDEVQRLNSRNKMMGAELKYDGRALTQVMPERRWKWVPTDDT